MRILYILFYCFLFSCGITKVSTYSDIYNVPNKEFNEYDVNFDLNYSDEKNWAFRSDVDDFRYLIPKNYKYSKEEFFNISVFYIHPTTLFNADDWNADTTHFVNNEFIDLCLENQASIFAGLCELYAPHYREMHIHAYTDTINGLKAFDIAYNDVLSAFKYFIKNIQTDKFIIASHSQGTNHAKRLINEYIFKDKILLDRLILSYLIGMDISNEEMSIELCTEPDDLYCFLNWRSFNDGYYPSNWNYGDNYYSINPITFKSDFLWSDKKNHKGILLPNQKILFKKSLLVRNEKGLTWVRLPKNIFLNKFKSSSYHRADFNLFWPNVRHNLIYRLENRKVIY